MGALCFDEAYIHRSTPIICHLFDTHIVILLKYLYQKGYNMTDWGRWCNNTIAQRDPMPRRCIGSQTC